MKTQNLSQFSKKISPFGIYMALSNSMSGRVSSGQCTVECCWFKSHCELFYQLQNAETQQIGKTKSAELAEHACRFFLGGGCRILSALMKLSMGLFTQSFEWSLLALGHLENPLSPNRVANYREYTRTHIWCQMMRHMGCPSRGLIGKHQYSAPKVIQSTLLFLLPLSLFLSQLVSHRT